ncbi:MAG: ribose 5-phosphate isomerase A [Chlamydiales bacterium]
MGNLDQLKKAAAIAALKLVQPNTILGLGSGTTVRFFIEALGMLCHRGFAIQAVASSSKSEELALHYQIPMLSQDLVSQIDITVDGADVVDDYFCMIKGGGGALLREKILAKSSKSTIIIIDESKRSSLHNHKIPIEILPFSYLLTINEIQKLGLHGHLRHTSKNSLFMTDNHNYIYDISFPLNMDIKTLHYNLISIPGVIETGLFYDYATILVTALSNGDVDIKYLCR